MSSPLLYYFCPLLFSQMPFHKKTVVKHTDNSGSINKNISDTDFCLRSKDDDYIAQARVTINDQITLARPILQASAKQ
jgi:hypothetical protein